MLETDKEILSTLRDLLRKELLEEASKVEKVLERLYYQSITKTNESFYAGAIVVTNRVGGWN